MGDNTIQEVKDRLNVVEVISNYISTKKSGANYKAVCPFHNEKTPSMMISPAKQIWHCFGCGEGGDVLKFIQQYENIEFPEALKHAADLAGVKLPQFKPANPELKKIEDQLKRINRFAVSVYQKNLISSNQAQPALEYLTGRGLTEQTIATWQIGYAPDSFDFLSNFLKEKAVDLDLAIKAGVLGESEHGKIYDRFRDRTMFPILDINSDVVGFSARAMPGSDSNTAKYINSPETQIYNKSKELFGLNFAKEEIRRKKQVVVVEGQMDVIQAHQAGFANTVATSGTALTELQLNILKRMAETIVLAFDSDFAGQSATLRATHLAMQIGCKVKIAQYKTDTDPDLIIKSSPKQWEKIVEQSLTVIDHYLEIAKAEYSLGSLEQKQFISDTVLPLLTFVTNSLEQDHYYKKISRDFAISESALLAELDKLASKKSANSNSDGIAKIKDTGIKVAPEETWEKEILGGILSISDFKDFVLTEGLAPYYISDLLKDYFAKAMAGEDLEQHPDSIVQEAIFMVESNLENLQDNELALLRELKKSFYLYKLSGIRKYLKELTIAIKKAELNKNTPAIIEQLNVKFAEASKLRFEIETKLQEA